MVDGPWSYGRAVLRRRTYRTLSPPRALTALPLTRPSRIVGAHSGGSGNNSSARGPSSCISEYRSSSAVWLSPRRQANSLPIASESIGVHGSGDNRSNWCSSGQLSPSTGHRGVHAVCVISERRSHLGCRALPFELGRAAELQRQKPPIDGDRRLSEHLRQPA